MKLGNSQNGVAEEDAESFEAEDRVVPLGLESVWSHCIRAFLIEIVLIQKSEDLTDGIRDAVVFFSSTLVRVWCLLWQLRCQEPLSSPFASCSFSIF